MSPRSVFLSAALFFTCATTQELAAWAGRIETNAVRMIHGPSWLNAQQIERVVDQIESTLEWDIRKVQATWYLDLATFQAAHGMGETVLAFTRSRDQSIHIGPNVTQRDFDSVFGHELAHVVLFQKYKQAIPKWLEEGLANYAAKRGRVDYRWLHTQPATDIRKLSHPYRGATDSRFHYAASTAAMEMIASRCSVRDLLQLSVGAKLEPYLTNYCGIKDLNAEFRAWVKRKSMGASRK